MEKVASSEVLPVHSEIAALRERHSRLEKRLQELERHLYLSPDEQFERSRLKKEKLLTKDRIARLSAAIRPS